MQTKVKNENGYGRVNPGKVAASLGFMALGTAMFAVPAMAATVQASSVMINLVNLMCSMFKYVGVAIFVWAIIQFILATKRSDADSKADAVQTAVCGIALMAIATIVNALGLEGAITGMNEVQDSSLDGNNTTSNTSNTSKAQ